MIKSSEEVAKMRLAGNLASKDDSWDKKPYPKVIPLFSMLTCALYEKKPNIRITTRSVSSWGKIFLIFTIIPDL